jgi:hypothetical protein
VSATLVMAVCAPSLIVRSLRVPSLDCLPLSVSLMHIVVEGGFGGRGRLDECRFGRRLRAMGWRWELSRWVGVEGGGLRHGTIATLSTP